MPAILSVLGLGITGVDTWLNFEQATKEKQDNIRNVLVIAAAIIGAGYIIAKAR